MKYHEREITSSAKDFMVQDILLENMEKWLRVVWLNSWWGKKSIPKVLINDFQVNVGGKSVQVSESFYPFNDLYQRQVQ